MGFCHPIIQGVPGGHTSGTPVGLIQNFPGVPPPGTPVWDIPTRSRRRDIVIKVGVAMSFNIEIVSRCQCRDLGVAFGVHVGLCVGVYVYVAYGLQYIT